MACGVIFATVRAQPYLRIEFYILSLHWMMKNMSILMYIYILYHQSNLLNYLLPNPVSYPNKVKYLICIGDVGTSGRETHEHNIVAISE